MLRRDRCWVLHGDYGFVTRFPLSPLQEMNHTLLQVNFLDCQDPSHGFHWSQGDQSTGEPGHWEDWASAPPHCPLACVTLSKSFSCFQPGLLKSQDRNKDPALPTSGECFKNQQQRIKEGGGGGGGNKNQLRELETFSLDNVIAH